MKFQPPLQQYILVALRSADDSASAKVVFDPNADASKGSLAVDFYVPSHDGKYVVVALFLNGSEDSSAHIFEVATGKALFDVVSRVNFATDGSSVEWNADGTGFYYTRYPQEGERPPEDAYFYQQVYFHKLGTDPKLDSYVIGKDFPRIAEIQLHAGDDARWLIASVANLNAPRGQIFTVPLAHPDLAHAKLIVPQSPGSITDDYTRASVQEISFRLPAISTSSISSAALRVSVFSTIRDTLFPRLHSRRLPRYRNSSPSVVVTRSFAFPAIFNLPRGSALASPPPSLSVQLSLERLPTILMMPWSSVPSPPPRTALASL
jgi:Prolyl oligopeptidase, N-terminal beta-propeller domain